MRKLFLVLLLICASAGGYFLWKKPALMQVVTGKEFYTFKLKFTADKIMEAHKKDLLKVAGSTFSEPKISYFPYLLMEVKYTKGESETREGMLLWGLSDGEMVVDADLWTKTHGFEDCLMAGVNADDFKVLRTLAANSGALEKAKLLQFCDEKWVENCLRKKLIAEKQEKIRLHLQNPRLEMLPHTQLGEWVVTLQQIPSNLAKKKYSTSKVLKLVENAFGEDVAIRRTREVFLPVHEIVVQHEDGSFLTTYWNGLTGKQIDEHLREI